MMPSFHFVFRATGSQTPFASREHSVFFWNQLSQRLNRCLALVLMPNHGHLIVQKEDRLKAEKAIRLSLFAFKRKIISFWDPLPEPAVIPDIKHLRRQIRYVHLNPCRGLLTPDPLCWEFSTHWDYLGYSVDSISVPSVQTLGISSLGEFHKFVSSDSTTRIDGTHLPLKVENPNGFPLVSLDRVAALSCALTRSASNSHKNAGLTRRLFYSLATSAGYDNHAQIAYYLKISQQSVSELFSRGRVLKYPTDRARQLLCDLRFNPKSCENHRKSTKTYPEFSRIL